MTLSALGIFSAAGAGGLPIPDYELISSTILGSNTPSITFSSLGTYSSTYKHLQLRMTLRETRTADFGAILMRFNGDSGSNYAYHRLPADGSAVYSQAAINRASFDIFTATGASNGANQFGSNVLDLLDPFSTTKNKTVRNLGGRSAGIDLASGVWRSTDSLTSIEIFANTFNLVTGVRVSLYGIKG